MIDYDAQQRAQINAIRAGLTIDSICRGISDKHRLMVAELLACAAPDPATRRRQRVAYLEALPETDRDTVRARVNQVLKARADWAAAGKLAA